MVKTSKNDNVYGVGWGDVVREYLKTAYSGEDTQADVVSGGVTYKVLKREKVTVFYDADGNTLFDVENKRLEKEYEYVMREYKMAAEPQEETSTEPARNDVPINNTEPDSVDLSAVKQMAKEKLEKEMGEAKDKSFAEPIIGHLLKRCEEDAGLAQDVMQEHKTWKKCYEYIFQQAQKQAKNARSAAVRYNVVYEWAEDYYRKDDKAEEEKKAKEAAERKKKEEERRKKCMKAAEKKETDKKNVKQNVKKEDKAEENPAEQPKPKKAPKEMDGQMDLFSMMGM